MPLTAIHFQRQPAPGQVSIERLFDAVRDAMPDDVRCLVHISPFRSRGLLQRTANMVAAARHQADVNHVTGDVHYLALALRGPSTLLTIHDCVSLERLRGLKRALFRWFWYVLPIRHAQIVSTVSEATKREVLRHARCNPDKIRVVRNCVRSEFVPDFKAFNVSNPLILQVGTGANKNLERVVEALAGSKCRMNILGALSDTQKSLLGERGIRYSNLPVATDVQVLEAYKACDMVVFASTYEGFGLPIIEANATGRPVVTANVLSMPEVAGAAACLVDPFDVASLRQGIVRVIEDGSFRQSLIEAGFENAKRFSAKSVTAEYVRLYRELMRRE